MTFLDKNNKLLLKLRTIFGTKQPVILFCTQTC